MVNLQGAEKGSDLVNTIMYGLSTMKWVLGVSKLLQVTKLTFL